MSTTFVESIVQNFAGVMSVEEIQFCDVIRRIFEAILESRVRFPLGLAPLLDDLRKLRQYDFDFNAAQADHFVGRTQSVDISKPQASYPTPSGLEQAFLKDADGLIDFAIRNGLTFQLILLALIHNLSELERYHWNLQTAQADHFTPKVNGWAERNTGPIGEVSEPQVEHT